MNCLFFEGKYVTWVCVCVCVLFVRVCGVFVLFVCMCVSVCFVCLRVCILTACVV